MQAWKFSYGSTRDLDRRFVVGIAARTKEEALSCLKKNIGFEFSIDRAEYLGEIHALSEECEQLVAAKYNKQVENAVPQPRQNQPMRSGPSVTEVLNEKEPAEIKLEEVEASGIGSEVECQFCGQILKGEDMLRVHENKCLVNPKNAKACVCEFCGREFKNANGLSYHSARCEKNPDRIVKEKKNKKD